MADLVPKKRQAITDLERRNIRRRRDTTGESQKELIAWFAAQPSGRPLTQGQISTILSPIYAYLDTDPRKPSKLGSKRRVNRTVIDEGMAEREALRVQISAIPGIQDPLSVDAIT